MRKFCTEVRIERGEERKKGKMEQEGEGGAVYFLSVSPQGPLTTHQLGTITTKNLMAS